MGSNLSFIVTYSNLWIGNKALWNECSVEISENDIDNGDNNDDVVVDDDDDDDILSNDWISIIMMNRHRFTKAHFRLTF